MKYSITCPTCGEYRVSLDFEPVCCPKCGATLACARRHTTEKTTQRVKLAMAKMDELKPLIAAARDNYMELMALYEDECQLLRQYAHRGIISREEVEPYLWRNNKKESLNAILKEYRANKAKNSGK